MSVTLATPLACHLCEIERQSEAIDGLFGLAQTLVNALQFGSFSTEIDTAKRAGANQIKALAAKMKAPQDCPHSSA